MKVYGASSWRGRLLGRGRKGISTLDNIFVRFVHKSWNFYYPHQPSCPVSTIIVCFYDVRDANITAIFILKPQWFVGWLLNY